jgi:hypothetical protein
MRPLLIFDLNGIFVCRERGTSHKNSHFVLGNCRYYIRPGTKKFLEWVHDRFDVAVWSSTMPHNTTQIVQHVWGEKMCELKFIFTQDQCTHDGMIGKKPRFLKEIRYVWEMFPWSDEYNTLLIDDSEYKVVNNPEHTSIHPEPYDYKVYSNINKTIRPYLQKLFDSRMCVQEFVSQNSLSET